MSADCGYDALDNSRSNANDRLSSLSRAPLVTKTSTQEAVLAFAQVDIADVVWIKVTHNLMSL